MRFKSVLSFSTLAAFVATLVMGCSPGTEVRLAPVTPIAQSKPEPLPKDMKEGGGPGSSGNAGMDPGAEITK